MKGWLVRGLGGWLFLSMSTLASGVRAQAPLAPAKEAAPAPESPATEAPAAPLPPEGASSAQQSECFPACRSEFLCHQGQCVSACNPICANNELCSQGECISKCNPVCRPGYACSATGLCVTGDADRAPPREGAPAVGDAAAAPALSGSMGVDLTFHTRSRYLKVTVIAPVLRAVIPFGRWTLEPELPSLIDDVSTGSEPGHSGFQVGNPTGALKYHWLNGRTDFYLGPGLSLPLLQPEPAGYAKRTGLTSAIGTRGAWNIWWYAPQALTIFMPIGVRHVAPSGLDVGGEAAFASFVHVGNGSGDTIVGAQLGGHLGYASASLETGGRLRVVLLPGDGRDDHGQMSFEAYVRALFPAAYLGGGFLVNLDQPLGPMLDTGSVWGLRLESGARF